MDEESASSAPAAPGDAVRANAVLSDAVPAHAATAGVAAAGVATAEVVTAEVATAEDPAEIARQREERARRRLRQTARDMLISMLVVSGAVLVLVLPWNRGNPGDAVTAIDATPVVQGARSAETWSVLAPRALPSGWRCTSARISTASDGQDVVHLGYLSPDNAYVGLEQSATKALTFVKDQTVGGNEAGTQVVAGETWRRLESDDGVHRSLVRTQGDVTYVVTGTASYDVLSTFTATLVGG